MLVLAVTPNLRAQALTPAGDWKGTWTVPEGYVYAAAVHLEVSQDQTVQESITWTLTRSPRPEDQAGIDRTGVEYIRGTDDIHGPWTGQLALTR